jgi:hypothetical protein
MGVKKWSEIKKLGKATDRDRAEAHAELTEEIRSYPQADLLGHTPTSQPDVATSVNAELNAHEGRGNR